MKKWLWLIVGFVSGLTSWLFLRVMAENVFPSKGINPIFNLGSTVPGIIFGLLIGIMIFLSANNRIVYRIPLFISWVIISAVAYLAAYNATFWPFMHQDNQIIGYACFGLGGLVGGKFLSMFLRFAYKLPSQGLHTLCIWSVLFGVIGSIIDFNAQTALWDDHISFPAVFILWQTSIAYMIGKLFLENRKVSH